MPGHAFLKVDVSKQKSLFIESTCLPKGDFAKAKKAGLDYYNEYFGNQAKTISDRCFIVNVKESRKCQIYPME